MSNELCGAWPEEGGCILPRGHNMGNADIPANHVFGHAYMLTIEVDPHELACLTAGHLHDSDMRDCIIRRLRNAAQREALK